MTLPATRPAQHAGRLPIFIPDYGMLAPDETADVPASEQVAALFDAGTLKDPSGPAPSSSAPVEPSEEGEGATEPETTTPRRRRRQPADQED